MESEVIDASNILTPSSMQLGPIYFSDKIEINKLISFAFFCIASRISTQTSYTANAYIISKLECSILCNNEAKRNAQNAERKFV